ncbi:MAG: flagellar hook-length control protein FliK [Anaerovibrio sp.]|uniref:flagellar hook-length control protein FliK n=1 Tax=Anaerovibrio sp. TaxID=1872532 RepID=UPI0025E6CE07|nr:flagellar hook-length control protein FliK [Anaerovibrio sp.]MCR5175907.1 flagellar hook-length control protein FliK [Anaerovibrio sp.]
MGTNVSANLFTTAPAVAGPGAKPVNASSVDGRSNVGGHSDKNFSSELKNAVADDKTSAAVQPEENAVATNEAVPAESKAEVKGDSSAEVVETAKTDADSDMTEVDVKDAEPSDITDIEAENVLVQMPMAELTTYFAPVTDNAKSIEVTGEVNISDKVEAVTLSGQVESAVNEAVNVLNADNVASAEKVVTMTAEKVVTMTAEKAGSVSLKQVQPEAGETSQMPEMQQADPANRQGEPGVATSVQQNAARANADQIDVQQTVQTALKGTLENPQPKTIEALLNPTVQVAKESGSVNETQAQQSAAMTNEQQMLAVLAGKRFVNRTPQDNSSQPVQTDGTEYQLQDQAVVGQAAARTMATVNQKVGNTSVIEEMNTLLGQEVTMTVDSTARDLSGFGDQGASQGQPQNFQQAVAQTLPDGQIGQVDEPVAFNQQIDSAQMANPSVAGNIVLENNAQVESPQAVNQPRADYNINEQIVQQARLLRTAENTEMVIKLNPRHLGDLTLKVAVNSNGGVTATFHTDNVQVRALLETSMIQLQKDLNEQGIKVDSVEVQTGLADGQLPEGQSQGYYQQQEQQKIRTQKIDLKDFEDDVESLAAEPVNNAVEVIRDSEGNKISDGVDYTV